MSSTARAVWAPENIERMVNPRPSGAPRPEDIDTLNAWARETGGYVSVHYSSSSKRRPFEIELNSGDYYGLGEDWAEAYRAAAEAVTLSPTLDPAVLPAWEDE